MVANVLFITDHMNAGGAPVVIRDVAMSLSEKGIKVTILILSNEPISHHFTSPLIKTYKILFEYSTWWERYNRYARHANVMDKWLEEHGLLSPDLTVAHLHHAHQVLSRSRVKGNIWYCIHSNPNISFLGNKRGLSRLIKRKKIKELYSNKNIVGVSKGIKQSLTDNFNISGDRITYIHNPLNIAKIKELSLTSINDIPDKYFLFVGRLEQRSKRFDRLLDTYAKSKVSIPLVIIGEGDARNLIIEESKRLNISEKVILLGSRKNPYPYMRKAHSLLLSSDYEGFPLVIAEALACNTPVISTDCPTGPREILTGELEKYLIPQNNPELFAEALRCILDNRPEISDSAVSHLDKKYVAESYLNLIKFREKSTKTSM